MEKLPNYTQWNCHKLAAIQFTLGCTAAPKAVGLSHYQLINGCRIAASFIGIQRDVNYILSSEQNCGFLDNSLLCFANVPHSSVLSCRLHTLSARILFRFFGAIATSSIPLYFNQKISVNFTGIDDNSFEPMILVVQTC